MAKLSDLYGGGGGAAPTPIKGMIWGMDHKSSSGLNVELKVSAAVPFTVTQATLLVDGVSIDSPPSSFYTDWYFGIHPVDTSGSSAALGPAVVSLAAITGANSTETIHAFPQTELKQGTYLLVLAKNAASTGEVEASHVKSSTGTIANTYNSNTLTEIFGSQSIAEGNGAGSYGLTFLDAGNKAPIPSPWSSTDGVFNSDFTRLYVVTPSGYDKILQFNMTDGDPSTLVYSGNVFSMSSHAGQIKSIAIADNDTKLFIGDTNNQITRLDLATANDLSTAFLPGNQSVSLPSTTNTISFTNVGDRMYTCGTSTSTIYEWPLSVGYDLTTIGARISHTVGTTVKSCTISPDGSRLYTADETAQTFRSYTFGTPKDITTMTEDASGIKYAGDISGDPETIAFNAAGTKMYVYSENAGVAMYLPQTPHSVAFEVGTGTKLLTKSVNPIAANVRERPYVGLRIA